MQTHKYSVWVKRKVSECEGKWYHQKFKGKTVSILSSSCMDDTVNFCTTCIALYWTPLRGVEQTKEERANQYGPPPAPVSTTIPRPSP